MATPDAMIATASFEVGVEWRLLEKRTLAGQRPPQPAH
jgi:hypothetical protein